MHWSRGRAIFTPIKMDKGVNLVASARPKDVLATGYLWEENHKQLTHKPLVLVPCDERSLIVGFTADLNFCAYPDGKNVLSLNVIFRGAAHSRPPAGT